MEQTLAANQALQPVKRVACNRCRTQKLKCNQGKDGRDKKCIRCTKAGTECTYSPPKRVGRPRSARLNSEKRKRRSDAEHRAPAASPEIKKSPGADEEEEVYPPQSFPQEQETFLGELRPNFHPSDFEFAIDGHDSWDAVMTPAADDPLLGPGPFCLDFEQNSATGGSDTSNFSPFHGDFGASDSSPTSSATSLDEIASQSLPLRIDAHKRFMQDLSELGIRLYAEIHEVESFGAAVDDKFISNVLHDSTRFLEIITSYQNVVGDNSSEEDCLSKFEFSDALPEHSIQAGTSQAGSKQSAFELDTAGIFEILTPYIRLVHLHSLMYTEFYDWLLCWPSKSALAHATFPNLSVGNQSLDFSGKFQIELFLRISLQILGEIEMRLGLPAESSVCGGYRTAGAHAKVLGSSVSPEVLKMALSILENGPGGRSMISLRERLFQINHPLKGINS
ncbi:uncharacterized protein BKA78DRAFT_82562 [Phyllosticta capitalensis]|uniref:uncharacterized protein n=1 Tax=Phyllosticta capitalensis TaxID=121624 RepID=UPI00312F4471